MVVANTKSIVFLYLLFISFVLTTSDESADAEILLKFKSTISDPLGSLSKWNTNTAPCATPNWVGIYCDSNLEVSWLRLENMGLFGELNLDVLTTLPQLRTLSFINNKFSGPLPDLKGFRGLKNIFFSSNNFSGEIPDDAFDGMQSLKKANLSTNGFTGRIPSSLARVDSLLDLWLDNNGFVGEIPDFEQTGLEAVTLSNNDLKGKIPDRLSKMDPIYFAGNKNLCGPPTKFQCLKLNSLAPSSTARKKFSPAIIAVIAAGIGLILIIVSIVVLRKKKKKTNKDTVEASTLENPDELDPVTVGDTNQARNGNGLITAVDERDHNKLVFLNQERGEMFGLQDLLTASAALLGNGEFGSSYKALLVNGPVVVKRIRGMSGVEYEDFHEHMKKIGSLSHPNLHPLVAYHYRKEEKLLVTDFIPCGSLATSLHGNRTADNPALDWPTRLKIIKGVTQALSYLYQELPTQTAPHGHLKSSNILLSSAHSPLLTDYGLTPLVDQQHSSRTLTAFRSPEYRLSGRISEKSDVWSLGVVILETLTGKHPGDGKGEPDLAGWVNSVVREEWTGEVFDGEMRRTRNGEGEMLKLLQVGLGCCEADVGRRWELGEVVGRVGELKEREGEEDWSCTGSEGEGFSSMGGLGEGGFSFSTNNPFEN